MSRLSGHTNCVFQAGQGICEFRQKKSAGPGSSNARRSEMAADVSDSNGDCTTSHYAINHCAATVYEVKLSMGPRFARTLAAD